MQKGRNQGSSTLWEQSTKTPVYLDSAYKELLRHDLKVNALKNRTKVLQLNQQRVLKQIQNNEEKLSRLESVKMSHSMDVRKMLSDKARKTQKINELKEENQKKRQFHNRQMSSVTLEKHDNLHNMKKEVSELRKQHNRRIEAQKEAELQKKKEARNKIHNELMESRHTIQEYFRTKHQSIVQKTKEDVEHLNKRRIKQDSQNLQESGVRVSQMEKELKLLRKVANQSRDCYISNQKERKIKLVLNREDEQTHPLLKRIESVMSKYTKFN